MQPKPHAASASQHLAPPLQRQQSAAAALQQGRATGKSAGVSAAALAAHLGSGGVLQDFLQLARDSVAKDASGIAAQISILDQVWGLNRRCTVVLLLVSIHVELHRTLMVEVP
jgi:hypothetical protein